MSKHLLLSLSEFIILDNGYPFKGNLGVDPLPGDLKLDRFKVTHSYVEDLLQVIGLSCCESNRDLYAVFCSYLSLHWEDFDAASTFDVVQEDLEVEGDLLGVFDVEFFHVPFVEIDLFKL